MQSTPIIPAKHGGVSQASDSITADLAHLNKKRPDHPRTQRPPAPRSLARRASSAGVPATRDKLSGGSGKALRIPAGGGGEDIHDGDAAARAGASPRALTRAPADKT